MEAMATVEERRMDKEQIRAALKHIRDSKGKDGSGLSGVERATGINRTAISQLVNNGFMPDERKLDALSAYLEAEYGTSETPAAQGIETRAAAEAVSAASRQIGLRGYIHRTVDYNTAFGAMDKFRSRCDTCVMIGHPGTGKTTTLKEYARQRDNTYYIDCWPYMGAHDLIDAITEAMDMPLKSGSVMRATKQVLDELNRRPGAMLIYDEAENLRGENVKKLDTLRKLCDDSPSTALFAGTMVLEDALKRGGTGPKSLGQIVRRNNMIRMEGVREPEVREMLREYDVDDAAKQGLIRIALDTAHGGMGNFVQLLNICLDVAQGGTVTGQILNGAKRYKLMY